MYCREDIQKSFPRLKEFGHKIQQVGLNTPKVAFLLKPSERSEHIQEK